jgi:hypothetical protein
LIYAFLYLLFLLMVCGIRTPVISGFDGTQNDIGCFNGFFLILNRTAQL